MLLTISGYNLGTKTTYLSHNEPLASIWAGNFHFKAGAALQGFWSWYRGLYDAHRLLLSLVSLLYLATALAASGSLAGENRELVRETNR
jgi:hypothetical protein